MPSRTAFLCVLQLILGTSAFAQNASSAASKDCQSSDTNRRLSGCTEVINARGYGSQSNLADALDGRCWAYNDKEQFTRSPSQTAKLQSVYDQEIFMHIIISEPPTLVSATTKMLFLHLMRLLN
jgi:hypothetical protein